MKACFRVALAAMFAICSAMPDAFSQSSHARLDMEREEKDLRVEKIRAKLDAIRKKENRPTVALVLSGGGAKGAAHVGVIRYLESVGIPVDVVLGTSMGGLVGGIYSLGYDADHLDSIIRGIDWDMALSDKVPRDYMSYSRIKYKEKYALSFPFYYESEDFLEQQKDALRYPRRSDDIHFGAGEADASGMVKDNLLESLPSGMVYGQNVNNILSSLTVGYQDEIDFYDLPTPFICVATDLVSGTAKIWTKGKLNTALRSTMSIPGLFTPVKTDGMVLVDGGMRNNYPTDLAKKVGADIVIGVTLSIGYRGYSEINNLGDIIDTGIDLMGRSSFESNVDIPDVTIKPDMHDFGMLSFDKESIDTIINRGYLAAVAVSKELDSLKKVIGPATTVRHARTADDISRNQVQVSGVEITGVSDAESLFLMNKLKVTAGNTMGSVEIEDATATIFGTNSFDYVNYELLGSQEPYRLKFNCRRGPVNQVGMGIRFDTEEVVSVLFNIGVGVQKLQGSALDFTGKVGINPAAKLTYSYATQKGMTWNVSSGVRYTDRNTFTLRDNRYRIDLSQWRSELFLSNISWSKFFLKTGLRNDYYSLGAIMSEQNVGDYDNTQSKNDFLSFFWNMRTDSFDDGYLPTKGSSLGIDYDFVFGSYPDKVKNFHLLRMDASKAYSKGGFTVVPSLNIRYVIGESVPLPYLNVIGGTMNGRYIDQQIAFYGVENAAGMSRMLAVLRCDLRQRLMANNYLTFIANAAFSANDLSAVDSWKEDGTDIYGMALKYTYNSVIGPISADLHWSTYTHKTGLFLSIGFDF